MIQLLIIMIICRQVYETNDNGYNTSETMPLSKKRILKWFLLKVTNQIYWTLAQGRPSLIFEEN